MQGNFRLTASLAILVVLVAGSWIWLDEVSSSQTQTASPTIAIEATPTTTSMEITSSAFDHNGLIPAQFTCDADGISPPLSIKNVPEGTQSLALILEDSDVPKQLLPSGVFDHWILFNISPDTTLIPEGASMGILGANGAGKKSYAGPCPPTQYEPKEHRYVFTLFALDTDLLLPPGATKAEVLAATEGHVVGQTQLIGRYQRSQ